MLGTVENNFHRVTKKGLLETSSST